MFSLQERYSIEPGPTLPSLTISALNYVSPCLSELCLTIPDPANWTMSHQLHQLSCVSLSPCQLNSFSLSLAPPTELCLTISSPASWTVSHYLPANWTVSHYLCPLPNWTVSLPKLDHVSLSLPQPTERCLTISAPNNWSVSHYPFPPPISPQAVSWWSYASQNIDLFTSIAEAVCCNLQIGFPKTGGVIGNTNFHNHCLLNQEEFLYATPGLSPHCIPYLAYLRNMITIMKYWNTTIALVTDKGE